MVEAKPLTASDIAAIKPKYVEIPETWSTLGSRGIISKNGKSLIIIEFLNDKDNKVGFFSDRMAKTDDGKFVVEAAHFGEQVKRAEVWLTREK
jgi:hypothetical protein